MPTVPSFVDSSPSHRVKFAKIASCGHTVRFGRRRAGNSRVPPNNVQPKVRRPGARTSMPSNLNSSARRCGNGIFLVWGTAVGQHEVAGEMANPPQMKAQNSRGKVVCFRWSGGITATLAALTGFVLFHFPIGGGVTRTSFDLGSRPDQPGAVGNPGFCRYQHAAIFEPVLARGGEDKLNTKRHARGGVEADHLAAS